MLRGVFAEDVHRPRDAAGALLDRFHIYECNDARTVGPLDDDFLIPQPPAGGKHVSHWTFWMRDQNALHAIETKGAAKANRRITDFRRPTPQIRCSAVVAHDEASVIANIDADRQQIQKTIGKAKHTLVKQDRQWSRGLHLVDEACHGHTPVHRHPMRNAPITVPPTRTARA